MKAISLWQPWASLWVSGRKIHETRHWSTPYRGWIMVHAAKKFVRDISPGDPLRAILDDEFGGHWVMDLPTGALIGRVNIVGCMPTVMHDGDVADNDDDRECGDFSEGRFAWRAGSVRMFAAPIPYRGRQGIFDVPDNIIGGYLHD